MTALRRYNRIGRFYDLVSLERLLSGDVPDWRDLAHRNITELDRAGIDLRLDTTARRVDPAGRRVTATDRAGQERDYRYYELVVATDATVVEVRHDTELAASAGLRLGAGGAIAVDEYMRTGVPHAWAAGDCVTTGHQMLGQAYLPLGTTAHKQGRTAGQNAVGGHRAYPGSLCTQVVKVFDLVVGRTGLRAADAAAAGYQPHTAATAPDRNAYYPARSRSPSASPATWPPGGCSASNSPGTSAARSPPASTPLPPSSTPG